MMLLLPGRRVTRWELGNRDELNSVLQYIHAILNLEAPMRTSFLVFLVCSRTSSAWSSDFQS